MKRRAIFLANLLIFGVMLTACSDTREVDALKLELDDTREALEGARADNAALKVALEELKSQIHASPQESILSESLKVVGLLKNLDMAGLSSHAHPTKGIRFSPYAYVDVSSDLIFAPAQVAAAWGDPQILNWGLYDGSGEPIQKTFEDYYGEFVYDVDFASPHMIGNNVIIGTGNMINNVAQAYPDGVFVEFHFTGFDPQYGGMDWRSLRLVFEDVGGTWYLVGIVHDEWTI